MFAIKGLTDKEVKTKFLMFIIFSCIYFILHLPMTYMADDATVAPTISEYSLWERFVYLFFFNGRIFTDLVANFFYRMPMIVWKIFDSIMYSFFAYMISVLFTKNRVKDLFLIMFLMLMFPIDYMASAGYVATTTNYLYTTITLLVVLVPFKVILDGQTPTKIQNIIALMAMLYAMNHDQTAIALLLGLLLWLGYELVLKTNDTLRNYILMYFIIAVVVYALMFFMPGHLNRMSMVGVGEGYPPNYLEWTFWEKVYVGYTSTVANLIFYEVELFFVLSVLCLVLLFQKKRLIITYIFGMIPSFVAVLVKVVGRSKFCVFHDYSYWLPDLKPITDEISSWIPFLLSIVVLISIIVTICICVEDNHNKFLILLLFVVAAASREMMGFSATVFKSSFRTFTFCLYAIMLCCVLIMKEIENSKKTDLWHWGMGAIVFSHFLF